MELDALLSLLPDHIGKYVLAALAILWELSGFASHASALLQRFVLPRATGKVLTALTVIVHALDYVAINRPKLRESKRFAAELAEKDRLLFLQDEKLRRRSDRIVELTALALDNRQALTGKPAVQMLEVVEVHDLPRPDPDNDNGTSFEDPKGSRGAK